MRCERDGLATPAVRDTGRGAVAGGASRWCCRRVLQGGGAGVVRQRRVRPARRAAAGRVDNRADLAGNRTDRVDNRTGRAERPRGSNRPDRIENRQEWPRQSR